MGTKGKQIVGMDVGQLIAELKRAYADEWLAAYAYNHMGQVVTGRPPNNWPDYSWTPRKTNWNTSRNWPNGSPRWAGSPRRNSPYWPKRAIPATPRCPPMK